MRKQFFIGVLVLLLVKVPSIQSGCRWEKNCSMNCFSQYLLLLESTAKIMPMLQKAYDERPTCHSDGIDLKLENLKYSGNTVAPNFFTANVNVSELSIILLNTLGIAKSVEIEIDAFRVDGFKKLKTLKISNINYTPIKKGTFNGLEQLEVLNIKGTKLRVIETGVLDVLSATLKEFSLEESAGLPTTEIFIEGLVGSGEMGKLESVKFKYNLNTTIAGNTFSGLTNVRVLDLSDCQIETIAAGAFDSMNSLEILKLKDNSLETIPDGCFDVILIRNRTQIFLKGNPFRCDCNLMPFKRSLLEHSNFADRLDIVCEKPDKFNSHTIINANFHDSSCDPDTTTVPTTSAISSTSPTSSTSQVCMSSDGLESAEVIFIEPPAHRMQTFETENDETVLRVDGLKENSALIWFSSNDSNGRNDTNCRIVGSGSSFRIDNLVKNSVYTVCLMHLTEVTVSPLDCISYTKRSSSTDLPWLYDNQKVRIIGIALVSCGLNTLLGLTIGILTHKVKIWTKNRKEPFIRSYQSSCASSMRRSRMSIMTSNSYLTNRTTSTTVQYFLNGNNDAPPLPARPPSMYLMDEPVYATIRGFASISAPTTQASDSF